MVKQKFKITNWNAYNKALVNRGSLTFWLDEQAIQAWYDEPNTSSRGRPQCYSELAISTVLMLNRVFRLTLRAAQGFIDSIFTLMKLPLRCPDYSCVSRRAKSVNIPFKTPTVKDVGNRKENNTYQANSGGYNLVDNSTTNNHSVTNKLVYHNSGSEQGNDAAVVLIPVFYGVVFITWLFFNNFDIVSKVVSIGSYTSPLLAVVSVIILFANNQSEITDIRNLIFSIALGLLVLLLNENAYYTAPLDVVDLFKQYSSIIDFWNSLSEDQHDRAFVTFSSYALIFMSGLLNHLISFR